MYAGNLLLSGNGNNLKLNNEINNKILEYIRKQLEHSKKQDYAALAHPNLK